MRKILCLINKIFIIGLVLQFNLSQPILSQTNLGQTSLSQTSFIRAYPKIISVNKDGFNDKLFLNYNNDEGKNLILKIYDIKGLMVLEKKISNTIDEKPESDGSYSVDIDITNFYNNLFNPGTYIFILTAEQKVLVKGSFAVVR